MLNCRKHNTTIMAFDQNWKDAWEKRWAEWKEDLEKLQKQFQSGTQDAEKTFQEQKIRFQKWLEEQRNEFKDVEVEAREEWTEFRDAFDKLIQKISTTSQEDAQQAEEEISDHIQKLHSEAENLEDRAKEQQQTLLDSFTDTMARWQTKLKAAALNIQTESSEEFEEWRKEARENFGKMKEKVEKLAQDSSGEWKELRSDVADVLEKFAAKLRSKPSDEDQA